MGHFVVSVSELQLQLKCLTAERWLPLEIFSTESLLSFLFDKSCEYTIQNPGNFCGQIPLLMENWNHPWRTTDLRSLAVWLIWNEMK